jgi:predicted PurR-regulated permease PerM
MTDSIIAASLAVLVAFAFITLLVMLPLIRDLRRAVSRVDTALARYEQDIGPLLAQARLTLLEMQRGAARVQSITGRLDRAVQLLDQADRLLSGVRVTVGRTVTPPVATAAAVIAGVRQAVRYLFSSRASDEGRDDGEWNHTPTLGGTKNG